MAAINITAKLVPAVAGAIFLSQGYSKLPVAAGTSDFERRMGFMLALAGGGSFEEKRDTLAFFDRVREVADLALDEMYGLRAMALNRPDDSQMAVLKSQIAAARSANGLSAL